MGTLFLRLLLKTDRHFTRSSEPRQGLATCTATGVQVPPFLSYFKTLRIGPAPGIEPVTARSAVKRSTTELTLIQTIKVWVPGWKPMKSLNLFNSWKFRVRWWSRPNFVTGSSKFLKKKKQIIGSLRKGVFERRTSTLSDDFSFLLRVDARKFVLQSGLTLIATIYPKHSWLWIISRVIWVNQKRRNILNKINNQQIFIYAMLMQSLTLNILLIWSISDLPGKSGFIVNNSANIQPTDHRSMGVEYSYKNKEFCNH